MIRIPLRPLVFSVGAATIACGGAGNSAFASEGYLVQLKCPFAVNQTLNERFHAEDDLDAMNKAQELLLNNSRFKDKGCVIVAVKRQ